MVDKSLLFPARAVARYLGVGVRRVQQLAKLRRIAKVGRYYVFDPDDGLRLRQRPGRGRPKRNRHT